MKKVLLTMVAVGTILMSCDSLKRSASTNVATSSPIKTTINLTAVNKDRVPVTIDPARFTTEEVTYRLPRVVQGTYAVSDFGKYVDDFKALDYDGKPLKFTKVDENTWTIPNAKSLDKITYLVNDTFDIEYKGGGGLGKEAPFSPSGTNIEPTNVVLNLHGFIGYFDSLKNNKYELEITSSPEFTRTSALHEVNVSKNDKGQTVTKYDADRYFEITDNPMFFGNIDVEEFKVGDIKIVLSVYSPNKVHTASELRKVMEKMMLAQKKYLGDINSTPRYDIYLYLASDDKEAPKGFGALEHHTSTVVVLPESRSKESLAESMTDVVSHEFFHIVTPLSVHSEDVHYFDYNKPTFSKHLWMYEGVTEYFAQHFQVNQGLVDSNEFYKRILGKINYASTLNDTMSFTKMSENILDEPYAAQYMNVYQKGALIAMCIDIIMREESNGNRGILSLMKELSLKYGKNKPFVDDAIIADITAMTYPSVGAFLQTHVVGTTPIDYSVYFNKVGLKFAPKKTKTNSLQNSGKLILGGDKATGRIKFNELVADNSFWKNEGVKANDVIKSINGTDVNRATANQVLGQVYMWQPGADVNVVLERNGKPVVIKTKYKQSYTTGKALVEDANATEAQKKLRNVWLKG